ncbi:transcriptional regulator [Flavobacterium acetivorans]|uniref:transcriptional regulator n=1 Tax=Flavobacterium acetivorans TaxID=2893883 RepID=UPI001E5A9B54|nr:transcriptional regulator [Flavobacterium sp. F-29]UFH36428.1 transcriptional regulator [Flavobacterium sp. F-29]
MNYIKHLTAYFEKVSTDFELNPSHVSLYMALFQLWNVNRFQNPISISRDEVMRISKICSKATYHKCMKDIHNKGYIKYEPSYNPFRGSIVHLFNFSDDLKPVPKKERRVLKNRQAAKQVIEQALNKLQTSDQTSDETSAEQVLNKQQTSTGTGTEQALVSYINNTNIINSTNDLNIINLGEQKKSDDKNFKSFEENDEKKKKLREKKEISEVQIPTRSSRSNHPDQINQNLSHRASHPEPVKSSLSHRAESKCEMPGAKDKIPPNPDELMAFFLEKNFPETEAQRFFNHFQSNGWLVGGKSKMKDWKAAARNWMLNATKFANNAKPAINNQPKPAHLHILTQKNYDEPL